MRRSAAAVQSMRSDTVRIRAAGEDDLAGITLLLRDLGYDADGDAMTRRLRRTRATTGHHVLVAESGPGLLGFLHGFERPSLEKGFEFLVQAMAVRAGRRGEGVGRALLAEAEALARAAGCDGVALHSRHRREDAHAFYRACGYEAAADAVLFRKRLR